MEAYVDEVRKLESTDRKSTRLNSSHIIRYRMPFSAWKKKEKYQKIFKSILDYEILVSKATNVYLSRDISEMARQ